MASIEISLPSQLQGLDNDNNFYPVNNMNLNNNNIIGNNMTMQKNPYNNNLQMGYQQQSNNNFDYYRNNNNSFMEVNESLNPIYISNKQNPVKNQMYQTPQQE